MKKQNPLRIPRMIILIFKLLLQVHNIHYAMQNSNHSHQNYLDHMRELRYHRGGDKN